MNILKEGVRGAFVKIIRLIVYFLLLFIGFYIYGLFSAKKASALVLKDAMWDPDMSNLNWTYVFGANNASASHDYWFSYAWYNNTDYDLMGFRFNKNTAQMQDWSGYDNNIQNFYTIQGILWSTDGIGHPCYNSGEWLDTFFCPIYKGSTYNRFTIMVYVFDPVAQENLELQTTLERNKYLVNYESTDIIKSIEDTGVMTIVSEQQETNQNLEDINDSINDVNDYIQHDNIDSAKTESNNALDSISDSLNDTLNGWGGQWSGLTHVIMEPINVALSSLSSETQCQPLSLTIPFVQRNNQLTIPCMSTVYNGYFSTFFAFFTMIISGVYSYRALISIFRSIKEVLDPMDDKLEVVDL